MNDVETLKEMLGEALKGRPGVEYEVRESTPGHDSYCLLVSVPNPARSYIGLWEFLSKKLVARAPDPKVLLEDAVANLVARVDRIIKGGR